MLPGSRARIVRCGGRYDPQLVKRSSEWVSEVDWSGGSAMKTDIFLARTLIYFCRSIIPAGSWDYKFLNPGSRDWEKGSGIAILNGKLWLLPPVVSAAPFVRRRNVYDKKSQRYAKDNRTAFNCVRSNKSVACVNVTNNKRLRSTFYTIEANYWQTRSIARPLRDSRAILVISSGSPWT